MRLREIRRSTAEYLVLLLEKPVALAQFPDLIALRTGHARLLAILDAGLTHPFVQSPDMDTEIFRDLRESDLRFALLRDTNHVVAELLGQALVTVNILPAQPSD